MEDNKKENKKDNKKESVGKLNVTELIKDMNGLLEDMVSIPKKVEPNILSEEVVKVFNGKENVEFTVLEIDAGSSLKIASNNTKTGPYGPEPDIYGLTRDTLQYKVKEIKDADQFLRENSSAFVNNIITAVTDVENKKQMEMNKDDTIAKIGKTLKESWVN